VSVSDSLPGRTDAELLALAAEAWEDGEEGRAEGDIVESDDVEHEIAMDELTETLPEAVAEELESAKILGGGIRLTELEPEDVLVFSCDEPFGDRDRWALFRDRDGATVLVTNGRTVRRYRGGVRVVLRE
jgi:hypothetical protein